MGIKINYTDTIYCMLWLDTVMFNGEPVLKARLAYLADSVTTFYICEQRFTHQGERKKTLYTELYKDWLTPYTDKIKLIIDETDYSKFDTWDIENSQRNYSLQTILNDYPDTPFIVSVCDCDEIPDKTAVIQKSDLYEKCNSGCVVMKQPLFYYNLNWFLFEWKRAFFLNDTTVKTFRDFQIFRNEKGPISDSFQCGWHLSYFLSTDDIRRKIESFAHKEVNKDIYKNESHVKDCVENGKDLYMNTWVIFHKNMSFNFPKEILELHDYVTKLQKF